ncbi:MAG TPA: asparagine synthase-related protein [Candidatus Udaeobacter sp.]|nr:asparagine synthase-related protein [Candidatus Udaeobacter sp.]
MPGIVGIISQRPSEQYDALVKSMVNCLMHEPFYTNGTLGNEELGLWSGWACHKGAFGDCLPIWNEKKDICLLFSGEDFTDQTDIGALGTRGHDLGSDDAGYLVHLYEEMGCEFLEELNGWFSGVLLDLREQKVVLFNDRYGVNRIFYHEDASGFYFSSEAKALLKILPRTRQLNLRSLGELVSCEAVLENRSLFSGISLLPAGSSWVFSRGEPVKKKAYFKQEAWESQPELSEGDFYEKLKETWTRVLPKYFHGKQSVGLSLTGGVDSRMILAWAPRLPGTLPCYTWGGKYRDCADVKIARRTARVCRQPHNTILVAAEFLSQFHDLAEKAVYISDGTVDITGSIDLYVQRLARQIAPVRLSGVCGGEILRRLVMFKPDPPQQGLFDPDLESSFRDAAKTYAGELQGHRLSFTSFKQAPWYMASKFTVERSQVTYRTPYFDNDLVALAYQTPAKLLHNGPALRLIADGNPALGKIGTDRGLVFRSVPGVNRALHWYQEFTFKAEYAYDYRMPQWLARLDHAFAPLRLERLFVGRHKFHHFRIWYRDELSRWLKEMLLDSGARTRPYLRANSVEAMLRAHSTGQRNYAFEIHKILTLEFIQRKLIELN